MKFRGLKEVGILIDEIKELKGNEVIATRRIKELKKELEDLKELILKTINIFEVALELKEVKSK